MREARSVERETIVTGGPETAADFAAWVAPHLWSMGHLAARLGSASASDDIVQEALTRAWRKRHLYDAARGTPRAWLLAIVADRATRGRRRDRAHVELDESHAPSVGALDASGLDLERAVASLPPRMRLAVDCFYFVGLTTAETAAVMHVSEGTVKSTLSDARAKLRARLEEES